LSRSDRLRHAFGCVGLEAAGEATAQRVLEDAQPGGDNSVHSGRSRGDEAECGVGQERAGHRGEPVSRRPAGEPVLRRLRGEPVSRRPRGAPPSEDDGRPDADQRGIHQIAAAWTSANPTATARTIGTDPTAGARTNVGLSAASTQPTSATRHFAFMRPTVPG
jgi:hypothetical protein